MDHGTTVHIEVLPPDTQAVVAALGEPDKQDLDYDVPGTVLLTFIAVRHRDLDRLAELASTGLAFRGWHREAADHYGMSSAACDGAFAMTPSPQGQLIMIRIDPETLEPIADDLAAAHRWRETEARVLASVAARSPPRL
jgi:hypothetical protein